jgi:hypothetical protein
MKGKKQIKRQQGIKHKKRKENDNGPNTSYKNCKEIIEDNEYRYVFTAWYLVTHRDNFTFTKHPTQKHNETFKLTSFG